MLGELIAEKLYEDNELVSFRSPGADGKPGAAAWQPLVGQVSTAFANGKPAVAESYKGGYFSGTRTYYYRNGQVFRRAQNSQEGTLQGVLTTYYPNGKVQEEENYAHDELHGRSRYYRPDGTLEREETYRAGEKYGPTVYYDTQGKPLKKEIHWNTFVYEAR